MTTQNSYDKILGVVVDVPAPFKRADILAALTQEGLTFTEAAVAGWINRAKVKGDIVSTGEPGSYQHGGPDSKKAAEQLAATTKTTKHPTPAQYPLTAQATTRLSMLEEIAQAGPQGSSDRLEYSQEDLDRLRQATRERQRGGFEFVGGLGVLGATP